MQAWPPQRSGLRRAGEFLLVVGASLQAFGAVVFVAGALAPAWTTPSGGPPR